MGCLGQEVKSHIVGKCNPKDGLPIPGLLSSPLNPAPSDCSPMRALLVDSSRCMLAGSKQGGSSFVRPTGPQEEWKEIKIFLVLVWGVCVHVFVCVCGGRIQRLWEAASASNRKNEFLFLFSVCSGLHLQQMEVPRLRVGISAAAAGPGHSRSNARSEPSLQPMPQSEAMPYP